MFRQFVNLSDANLQALLLGIGSVLALTRRVLLRDILTTFLIIVFSSFSLPRLSQKYWSTHHRRLWLWLWLSAAEKVKYFQSPDAQSRIHMVR